MTAEETRILFREWRRLEPPRSKALQEILRGDASDGVPDVDAPNLGWRVASSVAKRGRDQMVMMRAALEKGGYRWVDAAISWLKGGDKLGKWFPDVADVVAAYDLHAAPQTVALLKAALFAANSKAETVGHTMSLPVAVVGAFDALFFNVLDRKEDAAYRGKIVENDNGYGRDLIRRITGESGCPDLLEIAFHGTLHEVMVAARVSSEEERETGLVRKTRLVAPRVVSGLGDSSESDQEEKSRFAPLGLAMAPEWQDDDPAQVRSGTQKVT